jgi:hypothetical protein
MLKDSTPDKTSKALNVIGVKSRIAKISKDPIIIVVTSNLSKPI